MELKNLFSPAKIGNVQIKNRIIRSATTERLANKDGTINDKYIKNYTDLAEGGIGLIISGFINVELGYSVMPNSPALYNDSFISGQKKLVDAVHDYSDVKFAAQLAHTGRQSTHPKFEAVGPSSIPDKSVNRVPRELTDDEIKEIIKKFVNAGRRAFNIGYDMVQLHAAHGYLLSNFISPYSNKRTGEYGGDTKGRTKILVDIYKQLRDEIGKNFPIIIKLQTEDGVPEGMTLGEGKKIAKIVIDTGYDAIEVSGGMGESLIGTKNALPSKQNIGPEEENYFLQNIKEIRPYMKDCAAILVGGVKNPITVEKFLQDKIIDFISMCRPLIREPDLPNRWKNGDISPAHCISCNSCYMSGLTGPIYCTVKEKLEKKRLRKEQRLKNNK